MNKHGSWDFSESIPLHLHFFLFNECILLPCNLFSYVCVRHPLLLINPWRAETHLTFHLIMGFFVTYSKCSVLPWAKFVILFDLYNTSMILLGSESPARKTRTQILRSKMRACEWLYNKVNTMLNLYFLIHDLEELT